MEGGSSVAAGGSSHVDGAEAGPPPNRTSRPVPAPHPDRKLHTAAWLLCPVLFVAACWAMLLAPSAVGRWLPQPRQSWLLGVVVAGKDTASQFKQALSTSPYKAWQLGILVGRLQGPAAGADATPVLAEGSGYSADARALLAEAAVLMRVAADQLDGAQLAGLGATLQALEERQGPVAPVLGVLSAANLLWGRAILGVALSAGPAAVALSARLCRVLLAALAPIRRVAALVAHLLRLVGFFPSHMGELAAYSACAYIIGASERYPERIAAYMAVGGWMISLPVFIYVTCMHVPAHVAQQRVVILTAAFLNAALLPVDIRHMPQVMDPHVDTMLMLIVGATALPSRICWQVRFEGGEFMCYSVVASSVMLVLLLAYDVCGRQVAFQLGFGTSLGIALFQAGLVRTSLTCSWSVEQGLPQRYHYLGANLLYLGVTCGALAIGTWLQLPSLQNTAVTSLVLWVCEKLFEYMGGRKNWVRIFCSSLALSQVALFVELNSEWLTPLLQW